MTKTRMRFEQTEERVKCIALFRNMKYDQQYTFDEAMIILGFEVRPKSKGYHAYLSARNFVLKNDSIFIESVRYGFRRGVGTDMAEKGHSVMRSTRRKVRKGITLMDCAISENLPEKEHRMAMDMHTRFSLVDAAMSPIRTTTNRPKQEPPTKAEPFDVMSAIRNLKK